MMEFVGVADDVDRLNPVGLDLERQRVVGLAAGNHDEAGGAIDVDQGRLHSGHEAGSDAEEEAADVVETADGSAHRLCVLGVLSSSGLRSLCFLP